LIRVPDAYTAFCKIVKHLPANDAAAIEWCTRPVYVSASASYGQNVFIGAFAYLGDDVKVGNNTKIYPNVYLGNQCESW
jgi:UDP-3-O-[3-hydroxymyristoyl] glucosamine N-acyltransferase